MARQKKEKGWISIKINPPQLGKRYVVVTADDPFALSFARYDSEGFMKLKTNMERKAEISSGKWENGFDYLNDVTHYFEIPESMGRLGPNN